MSSVFQLSSYDPTPLSIPFIVATTALLALFLYVALMQGAALLRAGFLLLCAGLMNFVAGAALAVSAREPEVALTLYRACISMLPLASAGAFMFLLGLIHRLSHYRWLVVTALSVSVALVPSTALTDWIVVGVWRTPADMWYLRVGDLGWIHSLGIATWAVVGISMAWRRLRSEPSAVRRRQYRATIIAFSTFAAALIDVPMSYGVGYFPVSWAFLTVGAMIALRALVTHDLIRARAMDRRVPLVILYLAAAALLAYVVADIIGTHHWVALSLLLTGAFVVLRIGVEVVHTFGPTRKSLADSPLERVLRRYGERLQAMSSDTEVGTYTVETVRLAIGAEPTELLLPVPADYSWQTSAGEILAEAQTPDPMLLGWFLEHQRPLLRDDLEPLRLGSLREPLERLFEALDAEVIAPLVSRDEVVGLIVLGPLHGGRAPRRDELEFLAEVQAHAAATLIYTRMARQAASRVELDKEVGLAAAVQNAFVPPSHLITFGATTVCGIYAPATRCGGDWWSAHDLGDDRVLVLVGDVTGHGVAAAMVTAAAKGCYDVAERLMGRDVDLVRLLELLDAAVRRAGAEQFHMTCFATLLDPGAGTVTFANAGHTMPYLCRPTDGGHELQVLMARGNPLGAGMAPHYNAQTRDLRPGDAFVWYTDGLVECANPSREQFGDRRMQRLLRKIGGAGDARLIRDQVVRSAYTFMDGTPPDDDITLVVAQVGEARGA